MTTTGRLYIDGKYAGNASNISYGPINTEPVPSGPLVTGKCSFSITIESSEFTEALRKFWRKIAERLAYIDAISEWENEGGAL